MSLFKSRIWWEVSLNEIDSYDSHCLLTVTLDNDQYESILIANHQGFLRLYSPSVKMIDGTIISAYEASHLLLELRLSSPILQLCEGVLVSGSEKKLLAVLHPRIFSVYALKKNLANESKAGDQVTIELVYQHVLRHSAQSFILGSFGRVRGRQFICILSLDGLLSFYEQESFAFKIYLPDFLLSFNFIYLEKIDSFLLLNGFLTFDCYSYETLATAARGKKIIKSWEYKIGEGVLDVQAVLQDILVIIVLSERNLYGLNENGCLLFARRLEYTPVALCSYLTEEKKLMMIIATDGQYVNLYEEARLKWCFKINQIPVCIKRIFLDQLPGGLVLLSENGLLQCIYIGTHPYVYFVSQLSESELDSATAESEIKDLQLKIKNNDLTDFLVCEQVSINIIKSFIQEPFKTCNINVEVDVQTFVNTLQILIQVEWPLVSENSNGLLINFLGKASIETSIHLEGSVTPSSLLARIIVTYVTSDGIGGCITKNESLPLDLIMEEVSPVKESHHKLTFAINKPIVSMHHLFKEFVTKEPNATAVGVRHLNSQEVVTVLAAKSTQRYRIQSDSLPAMTLPLLELLERLKQQFRKSGDLQVTHCTPLPLQPYFDALRSHHRLISKNKCLQEDLAKECHQYRTIQKKILKLSKDTTPKSSSSYHKLLEYTSKMISTTLNQLEENEKELVTSRSSVTSLNRLVTILLELTKVPYKNLQLLKGILCPPVHDADDQGWLEAQEAITSYVLRTLLKKIVKNEEDNQSETIIEPLKDTTRLIKHLSAVIDRIMKGSNFSFDSNYQINELEDEKEIIPAGFKYVNFDIHDKTKLQTAETEFFPVNNNKEVQNISNIEDNQEQQTIKNGKDKGDKQADQILIDNRKNNDPAVDSRNDGANSSAIADNQEDDDDEALWDVEFNQNII